MVVKDFTVAVDFAPKIYHGRQKPFAQAGLSIISHIVLPICTLTVVEHYWVSSIRSEN